MTFRDTFAVDPKLNQLALHCFAHFEREEAMLSESLEIMQAMRVALVQRKLDRLAEVLEQQQHTAKAAEELRAARYALREKLAAAFGVSPADMTVSVVAARLTGDTRDQLLRRQTQLTKLAREVQLINQGNALLIRQSLELLHDLFDCMTGQAGGGPRYTAAGQIHDRDGGSTFDAEV